MKNKYEFFKKIYRDYVIVFDYNGERKTMGFDKKLLKYIKKGDINYIVIYNDFTIEKKICRENNYYRYLIMDFLEDLIMETNF